MDGVKCRYGCGATFSDGRGRASHERIHETAKCRHCGTETTKKSLPWHERRCLRHIQSIPDWCYALAALENDGTLRPVAEYGKSFGLHNEASAIWRRLRRE